MPASSTIANTGKNESDVAEEAKALRNKMMALKSISANHKEAQPKAEKRPPTKKKTCLCSTTTHPGSFRCRFHRAVQGQHHPLTAATAKENSSPGTPNLNFKGAGNLWPAKKSRFCSSR
ncbi:hypothetical protein MLD38_028239 [Melastoma candidum]|uniref:Uncharacterized protein n=1 Tax=Melastoma candidum TaxID=119954 RepID=A0ACB9N077_9MYRT|nr:hypothetical protein MLD38_028239 [Melastoma candidum]